MVSSPSWSAAILCLVVIQEFIYIFSLVTLGSFPKLHMCTKKLWTGNRKLIQEGVDQGNTHTHTLCCLLGPSCPGIINMFHRKKNNLDQGLKQTVAALYVLSCMEVQALMIANY